MKHIFKYEKIELERLNWETSWREMGFDSFEEIAILTDIEADFHTVFEDTAFLALKAPANVVEYLSRKDMIF